MNEETMRIVLDALAETIKRLELDVYLLKSENERLKAEIANHKEGGENA
jgi:uncharacterized small protein (DUF1192 family)